MLTAQTTNAICLTGSRSVPTCAGGHPLASIIIPTHNREGLLDDCIKSALVQTMDNIEIICVDDGSTDGTWDVLGKWREKDPRIRIFRQCNQFAGVARNNGLGKARGEYIVFLDSDDFLPDDAIENLCGAAQHECADVVLANIAEVSCVTEEPVASSFYLRRSLLPNARSFTSAEMYPFLFNLTIGAPGAKCFRRQLIEEHGIRFLPLPRSEDFFFVYLCLTCANVIAVDDRITYLKRSMQDSLENNRDSYPLEFWKAAKLTKQQLVERGVFEAVRQSFINENVNRFANNYRYSVEESSKRAILRALYLDHRSELGIGYFPDRYYYFTDNYRLLCELLKYHYGVEY